MKVLITIEVCYEGVACYIEMLHLNCGLPLDTLILENNMHDLIYCLLCYLMPKLYWQNKPRSNPSWFSDRLIL